VPRDVELFRRHFASDTILVNGLGPTECTLALQHFIDHQTALPRGVVPVGRAVEGVEVQLLNEAGEAVQTYATGEITLRSSYLALGYWRRGEQTAAAFLPDPDGGERRMYRTGDLGRLLEDGSIAYQGRRDQQVKIRGYRIEAGEIESMLVGHPAVRQAVVLAREAGGERQLVAYVVADGGIAPTPAEWREHLRKQLPEYMVPAAYVRLERIPLLSNGKADRSALLALEPQPETAQAAHVAPSTPLELLIARIWRELLGVEQIGRDDNFFDLGGHSLLSVRFVARFHEATGFRIRPQELVYQTLGQLAAAHAGRVAVPSPSMLSRLLGRFGRRPSVTPARGEE
jgi:catechol 2,3-dioxygenase-like lactoylglutathione lyase family enzyme